jgi:hypothetical protein
MSSNTSGMSVYLGEHQLPLDPSVNIGQLLAKLQRTKKADTGRASAFHIFACSFLLSMWYLKSLLKENALFIFI